MNPQPPVREIQRIRYELRQREVTVSDVEVLSPEMVRVTFSGEALADFVSQSFDDHVKFIFTTPQGAVVRRHYTPVRCDAAARTVALEFALHPEGDASDWARAAQVGQTAVIAGPRGSMIIPMDYDWHLLVGDSSALPAIRRRLEELPAGAQVTVVIQVSDAREHCALTSAASVQVHWVHDEAAMLQSISDLVLPAGDGFVWAAGEGSQMRQLRTILLKEKGIAKQAMHIAVYWMQGVSDVHERLDD